MKKTGKLKTCLMLFWSFFKIGAFTFGGGYAMIPLIQKEVVENKHWVTDDDILEIIAIAESTPGPIAINSATFIGNRTAGFWGSFSATFGVVLPSFCIILAIAYLIEGFADFKIIKYAFFGIRAGVLALLLKSFWGMFRKCPKTIVAYGIALLAFAASLFSLNTLIIIVSCAVIGVVTSWIVTRGEDKKA